MTERKTIARRTAARQARECRLHVEQLEDRRLLSGTSLLTPLAPVVNLLQPALSALPAPVGPVVTTTLSDLGLTSSSPSTPPAPAAGASVSVQTPLVPVSFNVGSGSTPTPETTPPPLALPGGSVNLTTSSNPGVSASTGNGPGQVGSGPQVNLGGFGNGGAAPTASPSMQPTPATVSGAAQSSNNVAVAIAMQEANAGTSLNGVSQAALAIALARQVAATTAQSGAAVQVSAPSFAGATGSLADAAGNAAVNGTVDEVVETAVRAGSYDGVADSAEESDALEEQESLPGEATGSGLLGILPTDGFAIDQALQQVMEQLNSLGQGLNQSLPGGLAFWLLAGALGTTACVTVRRRQAGVRLSGDTLAWIPSLTGFLNREDS